jgi:hypothetical protein
MTIGKLASVWAPLPAGLVASWAVIGVVAVVIIVRLRGDGFGGRLGGALFAIGAAALIVLCGSVRREAPRSPPDEQQFVIGTILRGSITSWPGTRERRFSIEIESSQPWAAMNARYVGPLPDGFEPDAVVVLRGRFSPGYELFDVVPGGIHVRGHR